MSETAHPAHEDDLTRLSGLARSALARFDLPRDATVTLINLSENATYRVDSRSTGGRWALRVHREGYHSRGAIMSELAWAMALRDDGAAVTPVPISGLDGQWIQTVAHPDLPAPRFVVLFQWESGEEPNEQRHDLPEAFGVLGETAARMHLHIRHWDRPADFERLTWDFETSIGNGPHWGAWRNGMGLSPDAEDLFARTADLIGHRLETFGKAPDRFGLIHGDMRLANLLIDGDTTKVIDFDDCGFGWLMYDCATTVSFFEDEPHVPALLDAWVRGYRRVVDLPDEDVQEIPTFVMLRRLLLVAWIGSHAETDLARSMGVDYTRNTVAMCEDYLQRYSVLSDTGA